MTVLGLTGGSGAGKTTVLLTWAGLGAYPIDADAIYHRLLREDAELLTKLRMAFPGAFPSGRLDRKALGHAAYASPERRRELERLTHGAILAAVERTLETARLGETKIAAVDALYLLENALRHRCAAVVGIVAPLEARIERIVARDGVSRAYAAARIAAQPDDAYYREHCDIILENNAGTEALVRRAEEVYFELRVES